MNNVSHLGGYRLTEAQADNLYDRTMQKWIDTYRHLQDQGETLRPVHFTGVLLTDGSQACIAVQEYENRQNCADVKKLIQVITIGEQVDLVYGQYDLDGQDYIDWQQSIHDGVSSALWFDGIQPVEF